MNNPRFRTPDDVVKPDDHWTHPRRYPRHKGKLKGQVYGGECNTTACTSMNARFWNQGTYALYCATCAHGHNWQSHKPQLTVAVQQKPTREEADQMHTQMMKDFAAAGGF